MKTAKLTVNILLLLFPLFGVAQEILSKQNAVEIALENNFDIRIADNNVAAAKNNANIKNSKYLPSVTASSSANYSVTDTKTTADDGAVNTTKGINTNRYNASVGLNYTIFDGFGRENVYRSLKESYNISELQARLVIEHALIDIFNVYYEVARLTENELNQKQTLDISRDRLLRAKYGFDYGQSTQLDVLNAEVDYNSDSITYLTIVQELENKKRNLNLLMGRDVEIKFLIDTTITYAENIEFFEIKKRAEINNVNILLNQSGLRNAEYFIKSTNAASIPKLGLTANYGAIINDLELTSFTGNQTLLGPSVGVNLSWNIFDGGATNIRKQNSKINLENQEIAFEQTKLSLSRNVSNAWNIYKTALFVLQAEATNLNTNHRNFDRTVEEYSLGQISSIVFRQAQSNLLTAQLNYNRAKYNAKLAELVLFQLSGDLLDATF